jgi:hypothetical protein
VKKQEERKKHTWACNSGPNSKLHIKGDSSRWLAIRGGKKTAKTRRVNGGREEVQHEPNNDKYCNGVWNDLMI